MLRMQLLVRTLVLTAVVVLVGAACAPAATPTPELQMPPGIEATVAAQPTPQLPQLEEGQSATLDKSAGILIFSLELNVLVDVQNWGDGQLHCSQVTDPGAAFIREYDCSAVVLAKQSLGVFTVFPLKGWGLVDVVRKLTP